MFIAFYSPQKNRKVEHLERWKVLIYWNSHPGLTQLSTSGACLVHGPVVSLQLFRGPRFLAAALRSWQLN